MPEWIPKAEYIFDRTKGTAVEALYADGETQTYDHDEGFTQRVDADENRIEVTHYRQMG